MFILEFQDTRFPVRPEMVLGRSAYCSLVLPHGSVSRRHAVVRLVEGGAEVEDLESRNGTFVNDVRAEGVVRLAHGDQLRMGDCQLRFYDSAQLPDGVPATDTARLSQVGEGSESATGPITRDTSLELLEAIVGQLEQVGEMGRSDAIQRAVDTLLAGGDLSGETSSRLATIVRKVHELSISDEVKAWASDALEQLDSPPTTTQQ